MSQHWIALAESAFPWEMAALRYLRERLPEQEPFRAWANFEFVADDGSINEVDLLVVSLYKVYLVEIKSRPGCVSGDTSTWTWTHEGHTSTDDNPLLLANRKAKKLKALLQRQKALHGQRLPYVEPALHQKSGYSADRSVLEDYKAYYLALKQAKLSSLTARSAF